MTTVLPDDPRPRFIWGSRREHACLRRSFTVPAALERAILRIFVDTGYELYLNGQFVAVVDELVNTRDYDVGPFLQPGPNLLALRAFNHGGHKGFACELRLFSPAGAQSLVSAPGWRSCPEERWGWRALAYDDSAWEEARELPHVGRVGAVPWKSRPGDPPAAVIPCLSGALFAVGGLPKHVPSPFFRAPAPAFVPAPAVLQVAGPEYSAAAAAYPPAVLPARSLVEAQAGNGSFAVPAGLLAAAGSPAQVLAPEAAGGPWAILDFGREVVGFLRLHLRSAGHVHLRLRFGEALEECYTLPPRNDSLLRQMITEELEVFPGSHEWECRRRQGFRYVRIEFLDCPQPCQVQGAAVRMSLYPVSYEGFFACSDLLLNRIWETARYTLHLCMQEYYLDGIKRDRLLWVADARVEALANYYAFADLDLFRFCWQRLADSQYPDGALPATLGEGQSVLWDFTAWWLVALAEYHLHSGDTTLLATLRESVARAVAWLAAQADSVDGLIAIPAEVCPGWFYTLSGRTGKDFAFNELVLRAYRAANLVAKALGERAAAARYEALGDRVQASLSQLPPTAVPLETLAVAVEGLDSVERLFRAGRPDAALDFLREHFAPMLARGGSSFREMIYYRPSPARLDARAHWERYDYGSNCHGWSAWPLQVLLTGVVGVRPLQPGFTEFVVRPQLGSLREARGVVPTPAGPIAAAVAATDREFRLELLVPAACRALVSLPGGGRVGSLTVNEAAHAWDRLVADPEDGVRRLLPLGPGGRYRVVLALVPEGA